MYEITSQVYTPEHVFAGNFPIVTDSVIVGANAIQRLCPVKLVGGKLEPVTKGADDAATASNLYGIAADDAETGAWCPVYLTGEFFASGLVWPTDVTPEALKAGFRLFNIYLK